ncbi:MAG: hypothetical protein Q8N51_06590, partial [Gammaproteobacteria bacterium]|nr:hypothetical protein [Gammaproteobacteria bacterium]
MPNQDNKRRQAVKAPAPRDPLRMEKLSAMFLAVAASTAAAQAPDKAIRFQMPTLPLIEGCNEAGGLRQIQSADEPGGARYWCGVPPVCLTVPSGSFQSSSHHCYILPYSRRNPRYSSAGQPGVNSV